MEERIFIERLLHCLRVVSTMKGKSCSRMFRGSTQPVEDDVDEEGMTVLLIAAPPECGRDDEAAL